MQEEKKYYTPTIEEFHVGFEYEYKSEDGKYSTFANSKGEWIKKTFENEAEYGMEELTEFQSIESALQNEYKRYGDVRVKYLDKEDIEALGWEKQLDRVNIQPPIFYWKKIGSSWYRLTIHSPEEFSIWHTENTSHLSCIFQGTIKNKSRLKLVMEMVGIA